MKKNMCLSPFILASVCLYGHWDSRRRSGEVDVWGEATMTCKTLNPHTLSTLWLKLSLNDLFVTYCLPSPQLFSDVCPKTSQNFEALCTGERGLSQSGLQLGYKGTVFHRVVPNGWVQGGGNACVLHINSIPVQQKYRTSHWIWEIDLVLWSLMDLNDVIL